MAAKKKRLKAVKQKELLKLDLGCGNNPREGFRGVDIRQFDSVSEIVDLTGPWPWEDESVEEAHSSHFVEHLSAEERIHFVNELYRVLIPDGTCQIIVPHWASTRAYGDLTHKWPPVSEFWFFYLSKGWRKENAPHNDFYRCNFDCTWGYSMTPELSVRSQETQQFALANYKEAAQDIICTLKKK